MTEYIESLVVRVEGAIATDRMEHTGDKYLKAVLWEIRAESWEDGVMWKGGVGTVRPERPPNPYLGRVIPSRTSDPSTSRAAEPSRMKANSQRAKLLEAFRWIDVYRAYWNGATDEDAMEQAVGVSPLSEYSKRCSELREAGHIEATGETRVGSSAHQRIVSRITDKGRAWIRDNT